MKQMYRNCILLPKQFLVTEWVFLTCSRMFLRYTKEQLVFKLEKIVGFRNMQEQLENIHLKLIFLLEIFIVAFLQMLSYSLGRIQSCQ